MGLTGQVGTFDEFMQNMVTHYPSATVEPDNEMQLVIYTGLYLTSDDDSNEVVVEGDPNG